ncbi:MAG: hypothetical protein E2O89_02435 [Alphaproteobacteria bacterium]|nr:MAG: hypothetical protein E2O89_02435 [Alphaproteobacteria bacterium]
MSDANSYISQERRRMVQVRRALARAVDGNRDQPQDLTSFYNACAEYIVYAQGRVHSQDQRIADRLKAGVPADQVDGHGRIDELIKRLQISRDLSAQFASAAQELRDKGAAQQKDFQEATETFLTEVTKALGSERNPLSDLTDQVMSSDDWRQVADATDDIIAQEETLFAQVRASAPAGLDPADMPIGHPQSWLD